MFGDVRRVPIVVIATTVVLTAVVSVVTTLSVVAALDDASKDEAPPLPTTEAELHEQVLALLPEPADDAWSDTILVDGLGRTDLRAVPPGRYEVFFGCRQMTSNTPAGQEIDLTVRTSQSQIDPVKVVRFPCPSTLLSLDRDFDFTEAAAMTFEFIPAQRTATTAIAIMITGTAHEEAE